MNNINQMHTSCSSTPLHTLLYTGHSRANQQQHSGSRNITRLIYSKTCRAPWDAQNSRVEQGARNLGEEHHWHARSRLAPALTPLRLPELADSEEHQKKSHNLWTALIDWNKPAGLCLQTGTRTRAGCCIRGQGASRSGVRSVIE